MATYTGSIRFKDTKLFFLDQTCLPHKECWRQCRDSKQAYDAIKTLKIRGAPLIGVFAAYSVYIGSGRIRSRKKEIFLKHLKRLCAYLNSARPTAVNLSWALERIDAVIDKNSAKSISAIRKAILKEAQAIHKEDVTLCRRMARHGVKLIRNGEGILTHCNTGFLATSGEGTALAVIYEAHRCRKNIKVYVDETRPLLQGARLTAWELHKRGVNATLISDNMAGYLMQQKKIKKVFVGADRIAANGDTANKIGTYSVAVLANYHSIPFYVVAPRTTFDLNIKNGSEIPIEERNLDEVRTVLGKTAIAPRRMRVYNPAFDLTPHRLITAIITDSGIIRPPFTKNITNIIGKK